VATKTTLLEGSIKVESGTNSKMLKPGQQSAVSDGIVVSEVDVNQVLDWKNNSFYFADENIRAIMRKLARWYDLDVVYEGRVPDFGFGAEISRTKKLSEVLKALETTGKVHFKIEGRRVTVMP
jgi:ferric-dicitrate binding protein FerR (iron transport regulator)